MNNSENEIRCRFCCLLFETEEAKVWHEFIIHGWGSNPISDTSADTFIGDYVEIDNSSSACKHKNKSCDKCGTTSRRDYKHKTINGKGIVGRIKKK